MQFLKKNNFLYFVGIGGIGMSGVAEILYYLGYKVQGSDVIENSNVKRLKKIGILIFIGHHKNNIKNASVLIISSAIGLNNIELIAARKNFIPIIQRVEILSELMSFKKCITVTGTHGKTTTTSLISCILEKANFDISVINGGIINDYNSNVKLGFNDWIVVEADESDGSFIKLPVNIGIITNIDYDHVEYYGSFNDLKNAFKKFLEKIPSDGFAVICIDNKEIQSLFNFFNNKYIITYGQNSKANVRFFNLEYHKSGSVFSVEFYNNTTLKIELINKINLPLPGLYNVYNAVAAISVAINMGVKFNSIKEALKNFNGINRRFTKIGTWNDIMFFDDYAHHPTEISSVLSGAKKIIKSRLIAIVQPHRYTRLKKLFNEFTSCFNDADIVIICPVFSAGEKSIEGINHISLVNAIRCSGHNCVIAVNSQNNLLKFIINYTKKNDFVLFMGAGDINILSNNILKILNKKIINNN